MLLNICCLTLVFAVALLCPASAFTTRFIMEDVGRPQVDEKMKEPIKDEDNTVEVQSNPQNIEVNVIPIMTDSFVPTEDLLNMTPLKLVTAVSAEHLLNVVRNIPLAGNSAQDILDMLSGVVREMNKTAAIIKLTAEYVNVSSHYMMSALEQFNATDCEEGVFEESVKSLRKKFYKSIAEHIMKSVKELFEKTRKEEMTGNDILISSAYHIVKSFQEMTNEVMAYAKEANKKCKHSLPNIEILPMSGEKSNTSQNNASDNITVDIVPGQGNAHKSIKKDQATNKPDISVTVDNKENSPDLTMEVFSPEVLIQNADSVKKDQEDKPTQYLKIARVPLFKTVSLFSNSNEESKVKADQLEEKKTEHIDKELTSDNVDSLSNVPWESSESERNNLDKAFVVSNMKKSPQNLWNILQLMTTNLKPSLQQPAIPQCDDTVVPVCGIDDNIQKFIIFLNECKRNVYNMIYGTNYKRQNMDTCVGFFLRNQAQVALVNQTSNVDLRPR